MGLSSLTEIEPAYVEKILSDIDARLASIEVEKKALVKRRAEVAKFAPKPARASKKD